MKLSELYDELSTTLAVHPNWRPFVCDGDPTEAVCWIVGFNPASGVRLHGLPKCTHCGKDLTNDIDFLNYLCRHCGFDKCRWLVDYETTRHEDGRRTRRSTTRGRIEIILKELEGPEGAAPYLCVETNVYATPTIAAGELNELDTSLFERLLVKLKPVAILIHGRQPGAVLTHLLHRDNLPHEKFQSFLAPWGRRITVKAVPHFASIGNWNRNIVHELGREFRRAVKGVPGNER